MGTYIDYSNFPLLKSPQELGRLFPFHCCLIDMAVWSGLFSAAVWKMKSASVQCIELSNHGINTSNTSQSPSSVLKIRKGLCEKPLQWRQMVNKMKNSLLGSPRKFHFSRFTSCYCTIAELHICLLGRADFRNVVSCAMPETI